MGPSSDNVNMFKRWVDSGDRLASHAACIAVSSRQRQLLDAGSSSRSSTLCAINESIPRFVLAIVVAALL
jgi:hypothetical protein